MCDPEVFVLRISSWAKELLGKIPESHCISVMASIVKSIDLLEKMKLKNFLINQRLTQLTGLQINSSTFQTCRWKVLFKQSLSLQKWNSLQRWCPLCHMHTPFKSKESMLFFASESNWRVLHSRIKVKKKTAKQPTKQPIHKCDFFRVRLQSTFPVSQSVPSIGGSSLVLHSFSPSTLHHNPVQITCWEGKQTLRM